MPNQGVALQNLVALLEKAAANSSNVKIESPKRLRDIDTGKWREHDVVLTHKFSHHVTVTALECRDRSRKTTVNDVEGFASKCSKTGIHRGIIVSISGFTKTAIEKSKKCNIGCLSLTKVESFDWCLAPGMSALSRDIINVEILVSPIGETPKQFSICDETGQRIDRDRGVQVAVQLMKHVPFPDELRAEYVQKFIDKSPKYFVIDEGTKLHISLKEITISVKYRVVNQFILFKFHEYFDAAVNGKVLSAATANLSIGNMAGSFVLARNEKDGITISFVPTNEAKQ